MYGLAMFLLVSPMICKNLMCVSLTNSHCLRLIGQPNCLEACIGVCIYSDEAGTAMIDYNTVVSPLHSP